MPSDRSLEIDKPSFHIGFSPVLQILSAGLVCVALSFVTDLRTLQLGLVVFGATLCCVSGWIGIATLWRRVLGRWQRANARRMIAHDLGAGFVTLGARHVDYANAAAKERFETAEGVCLPDVFRHMWAKPHGLLDQLVLRAAQSGASAEDIVTRAGHFRLRVLWMGPECQVWWLDDLTGGIQSAARGADAVPLPMISVDLDGTILQTNKSMRGLLGEQRQHITDVFFDLPIRSGQCNMLHGADGPLHRLVVQTPGKDDTTDIYLLPEEKAPLAPPQLEGGWDAIDDLPVPLLKVANDGQLLAANSEARALLHIPTPQGRRLSDVLDGPGRLITDWLEEALNGRSAHVSQFLRVRGASEDTFIQVTLSIAGEQDDPHLIAVLNDVTELKTLESQFVQSQKMQAIGQLAGGVAHDFNNLLTAISGHCDLLLLRHDEGDQNYGDLIQIHQNANRAASLVGQLLAFSRKQNLLPEEIDLRDTMSDLTHLLNRLVGEKVTLTLDHDCDLLRIKADKRQLEQVMMNLVVNARDAMQGTGEIKIVTKNLSLSTEMTRDRVTVPKGSYVMVKVKDDGHGIASETLDKIFEPFWTTKRQGEGTGLGLSTAYGIVKQTGGYIFVESEIGRGTTFTLLFPSLRASAAAPMKLANPETVPVASRAEGVVLLVEDEAPVRAFASRALRLRGYTVLEADCAEAALDLLSDPDLVVDLFVTDVIMPGMDGPTWVRKARVDRPTTKVVFVSGYPEDAFDDGEAMIENTVFLPKPFSLTDLTQTVQGQLAKDPEPA
ncbi:ATP-binding protein [Loktanella sp. Alg231-35]|uniref:ATP-binding protein n=1 Tax=Loktanella sp. Alg231-35 TaxID=1922220 RepID=UPI001F4837C2|nr:ATP-binding protein [Loktanella sp. Alg231-35]